MRSSTGAPRTTPEQYWATPQMEAVERMKLFRLAWDLVGSEFAGRHQQHEKFYAGPYFVVRNHSYREAPWQQFEGLVDRVLEDVEVPAAPLRAAPAARA